MKNNKKGISAVVATVLMILITVAAVTIIWAAVIPMINDNLNRGTVCLTASTALTIENRGFTCFDNASNIVNVQVAYGAEDIGLKAIQILISDDVGDTTSTTNTILPGNNGKKTYGISYSANAVSVAVAPIIDLNGQNETCDASAPVKITLC